MTKILVDSCVYINAFKEDSEYREQCISFLEAFSRLQRPITMPAHGWFEVWCNLKRIEKIDQKFKGVSINDQWSFPLELIHIDAEFIGKYGNVQIPYAKAGDHIYLVVAHVNRYPLVTTDGGMAKIARQLGISVYSPSEFLVSEHVA